MAKFGETEVLGFGAGVGNGVTLAGGSAVELFMRRWGWDWAGVVVVSAGRGGV